MKSAEDIWNEVQEEDSFLGCFTLERYLHLFLEKNDLKRLSDLLGLIEKDYVRAITGQFAYRDLGASVAKLLLNHFEKHSYDWVRADMCFPVAVMLLNDQPEIEELAKVSAKKNAHLFSQMDFSFKKIWEKFQKSDWGRDIMLEFSSEKHSLIPLSVFLQADTDFFERYVQKHHENIRTHHWSYTVSRMVQCIRVQNDDEENERVACRLLRASEILNAGMNGGEGTAIEAYRKLIYKEWPSVTEKVLNQISTPLSSSVQTRIAFNHNNESVIQKHLNEETILMTEKDFLSCLVRFMSNDAKHMTRPQMKTLLSKIDTGVATDDLIEKAFHRLTVHKVHLKNVSFLGKEISKKSRSHIVLYLLNSPRTLSKDFLSVLSGYVHDFSLNDIQYLVAACEHRRGMMGRESMEWLKKILAQKTKDDLLATLPSSNSPPAKKRLF